MQSVDLKLSERKEENFLVVSLDVFVENLPSEFEGYRFTQLTDFHYGSATSASHIEQSFKLAAREKPDLVLLTGDYLELSSFGLREFFAKTTTPRLVNWSSYRRAVWQHAKQFAEMLELLSPPDGIIVGFGNHDHYEGLKVLRRFLDNRALCLINEAATIRRGAHNFCVAAVDDLRRGEPSLQKTLAAASKHQSFFNLLVSHNPDITLNAKRELLNSFPLVICGHTHGGQVCLPWGIPLATRTKQRAHVSGLSRLDEHTQIYVSRGIGYGTIKLRLFCPPEITTFTLRRS